MQYLEKIKIVDLENSIIKKIVTKTAALIIYRFRNYAVIVIAGDYRNGIEVEIVDFCKFTTGTFPMISYDSPMLPKGAKKNVSNLHSLLLDIKRWAEQEATK